MHHTNYLVEFIQISQIVVCTRILYEEPKKNLSNKADWCLVLTGFGLFPDSISGVDQKCHFQLHNSMVKKVPVGKEPIKAYPVWVFWFNTQKRRQFFRQIHHCMMSRQEKGITRDLSHLLHHCTHLLILQWGRIRTKCSNFLWGESLIFKIFWELPWWIYILQNWGIILKAARSFLGTKMQFIIHLCALSVAS